MIPSILYKCGNHRSFIDAGKANIKALETSGVKIVPCFDQADLVILHDMPIFFPRHFMLNPKITEKYIIAYSVWETDCLPDAFKHNLRFVDEIWTPSTYCKAVFGDHHDNVHVMPHVTDIPPLNEKALDILKDMIDFKEDEFYFYTIADATARRKNLPIALRMFPQLLRGRNARYILKTDVLPPHGWEPGTDQITILPSSLSTEIIHALHHIGHCYVSPHASEGWGLCLSDAMAHGNLVVATDYGGNTDFMNSRNSLPVNFQIAPAHMNTPFPSSGNWASIDRQHLMDCLMHAIDDWDALKPLRDRAALDSQQFDVSTIGQQMVNRIKQI